MAEASSPATLAASLTLEVRRSIMRGDFRPGTRLHLATMRAHFGTSLSPLREALCRLESEGLVRIENQRGYRVAAVSSDNLREVVRLRVSFEGMALREAMASGDRKWEDAIASALVSLQAFGRTRRLPDEQERWEEAHRRFHIALIAACGLPLLMHFCTVLHDQSDRYRRLFLRDHVPDRDVPAEHAAIAAAVVHRDESTALALLGAHIERTGHAILATLAGDEIVVPQTPRKRRPRSAV